MKIKVIQSFAPAADSANEAADVRVFFDVFRASTTLAALASVGAGPVLSTNSLEVVRRRQAEGYQLVSEVFDGGLDNSPTQVLAAGLGGRRVIHKSTNLTAALFHRGLAPLTLIGGIANASHVIEAVQAARPRVVELVAAGHFAKGREAVEDTAGAELIARALRAGALPAELPRAGEIAAKIADLKARKPDIPERYWSDVELALRIDALPHAMAAVPTDEPGVVEMRPVAPRRIG